MCSRSHIDGGTEHRKEKKGRHATTEKQRVSAHTKRLQSPVEWQGVSATIVSKVLRRMMT